MSLRVNTLNLNQLWEELAQIASGQSAQEAIAFAQSLLTQAASLRHQPAP